MKLRAVNRSVAATLAAALLLAAPGIEPYRLMASVAGAGKVPVNVAEPGLGSPAAGAANAGGGIGGMHSPGARLDLRLGSGLPGTVGVKPQAQKTQEQAISAVNTGVKHSPSGSRQVTAVGAGGRRPAGSNAARAPPGQDVKTAVVNKSVSVKPSGKMSRTLSKDVPVTGVISRRAAAKLSTLKKNAAIKNVISGRAGSLRRLFHGAGLRAVDGIEESAAEMNPSFIGPESVRRPDLEPASPATAERPLSTVEFVDKALAARHPRQEAQRGSLLKRFSSGIKKRLEKMKDIYLGFNKSERAFLLGQAVFLLALSIYLASLPLLVKALTGDAAMTGVARAVHYWVFAGASLFSGGIAKRTPMKKILVGASGSRAIIFGSIGVLALIGALPWAGFLVLVGVNALIVSVNHLVDIDTDGARKVFDSDKKIEQAGYIYDFIFYGMMLVVPPLIGIPMDILDAAMGAGIGAAVGYAFFAGVMGLASYIYWKNVRVIGQKTGAGMRAAVSELAARLRAAHFAASLKRTLNGMKANHWAGAGLAAAGAAALVLSLGAGVLTGLVPIALGAAAIGAGVIGMLHWDTLKTIFHNKAILSRFSMETGIVFLDDAFFNVVLPTFAIDILMAGAFGNGLLLSAGTFGGLLASVFLVRYSQKLQGKMGTYPFLMLLTAGAVLAFIPSIGLWALPSMLVALPAAALIKLLVQPLRSRMRALLQTNIKNDPEASRHGENIFALMTVFEVLAAGAGGLAFAWLFKHSAPGSALFNLLGAHAPMKVVTLALMALIPIFIGGLWMMRRELPRRRRYYAHSSRKKLPRGLGRLSRLIPARFRHDNAAETAEYAKLAKSLKRLGLPPYRTIRIEDPVDAERPTVAILAPPSVYKLAIIREGGKQSAGDVHLAMDPSWLIQEQMPDGKTRLLLTKGLFFDDNEQAVVAEYDTPRPVRYFADFYTLGANDRDDGVPFEKNLDVPMSSSLRLEKITNDKLLTRIWLAAKGVAVPATMAVLLAAHPLAKTVAETPLPPEIALARMPEGAHRRTELRAKVADFLKTNAGTLGDEIVVKPSGPAWHSSKGVEFFKLGEAGTVDAVTDHMLALAADREMTPDGSVLIDSRISPPALHFRSTLLGDAETFDPQGHDSAGFRVDGTVGLDYLSTAEIAAGDTGKTKKDWNLRLLISRTPAGSGKVGGIFARAGAWGIPTVAEPGGPNAEYDPEDAAVIIGYEDVLAMLRKQHGLSDVQIAEFDRDLRALGPSALQALGENESKLEREDGAPYQAQTDYIGLDVMVERRGDKLVPMVIEINDHDSGGQHQLDLYYPDNVGEHSREWVATMLARARRDALKGKTIVMVGAGYEGKRFFFEKAKELGVKVVLIDVPGSWAADLVDEYIVADTLAKDRKALARSITAELQKRGLANDIDGITSFWEDDIPLTARLGEELKLPYISYRAAVATRNKAASRALLEKAGLPSPRYRSVMNAADLEVAIEKVGFPAILKPASGAESKGTRVVRTAGEARAAYAEVTAEVARMAAGDGAFSTDAGLVLEQYLIGQEVDVDIVMRGGKSAYARVSDNSPTQLPYFIPTGAAFPSRLPAAAQRQLEDFSIAAAKALGLNDGTFHIEAMWTDKGPRLIEANPRPGGEHVVPANKAVWGVDMAEEMLMAAANIPGPVYSSDKPLTHLEIGYLIPEYSGTYTELRGMDAAAKERGFHSYTKKLEPGPKSKVGISHTEHSRLGYLTTEGPTAEAAAQAYQRVRGMIEPVITPAEPAGIGPPAARTR